MTRPPTNWRSASSLTLTEAAAVWGVSRSLAYEWCTAGRFSTMPSPSGQRRLLPAEVERVLKDLEAERGDQDALFGGTGYLP